MFIVIFIRHRYIDHLMIPKLEAYLQTLALVVGGFTISDARGGWVGENGLVYDNVQRVEVAIQGETIEEVERKLEAVDIFAEQCRVLFEQESVMISRFHNVSTEFMS